MLFIIAWRNIWRNKVRSIIIIASMVIGLWAGLFVMGFYSGMAQSRVQTAIQNEISHIQIHTAEFRNDPQPQYAIRNSDSVLHRVRAEHNVKAASGRNLVAGMLMTATGSNGVQIFGVNPADESQVTQMDKYIIEGNFLSGEKKNQVVIGEKLADKMKLKLKSKIVLTFQDKDGNLISGAFRISGIFKTSNALLNERIIYTNQKDLAVLLGTGSDVQEIAILLKSNEALSIAAAALQKQFPDLKVETWMEISPETSVVLGTTERFSTIFLIIILLALAFGIINTMLMAILERRRELGMMISLGMNRFRIFGMVVYETFLLVMIGCPFGILIGSLTIQWLNRRGMDLSSIMEKTMEQYGYSSVIYPQLNLQHYMQVIILVACVALFSGIFPALKAMRLNPAQAIKV